MTEMMVVTAVIAIMCAIILPSMRGAKRSSRTRAAASTAQSYAQAISAFQLDHRGRTPVIGGADWPAGTGLVDGPLDMLGRRYLKNIPDTVTDGRVPVIDGAGGVPTSAPPDVYGRVRYERTSDATWSLIVDRVEDGVYIEHCRITSAAGGTPC